MDSVKKILICLENSEIPEFLPALRRLVSKILHFFLISAIHFIAYRTLCILRSSSLGLDIVELEYVPKPQFTVALAQRFPL